MVEEEDNQTGEENFKTRGCYFIRGAIKVHATRRFQCTTTLPSSCTRILQIQRQAQSHVIIYLVVNF